MEALAAISAVGMLLLLVLGAIYLLLAPIKLYEIHKETKKQNELLFAIAVALKANLPEDLRPVRRFFKESKAGIFHLGDYGSQ